MYRIILLLYHILGRADDGDPAAWIYPYCHNNLDSSFFSLRDTSVAKSKAITTWFAVWRYRCTRTDVEHECSVEWCLLSVCPVRPDKHANRAV